MTYLLPIILGFLLSFIGSLPLGIINMTVADTAIHRGMKAGIWVAIGASLVEFIQSFVAIKFTWLFSENSEVDFWFGIIAFIVFWALAIYYFFFAKASNPASDIMKDEKKHSDFFKGMLVSAMNVLVIPYWVFYGSYLNSQGWLSLENEIIAVFAIGVMLGTFVLLLLYAKLGQVITSRAAQVTRYVNKFIGGIFLLFALYQTWKVFLN